MTKIPNLFKLMLEKNVSAKKLSDDTGISTGNISDWKSGRSAPTFEKITLLSDYFQVSADYLLGKTDEPKPIDKVNDEVDEYLDILHKRGDMRMLFSVAKSATKEDIELAAKIIEDIIKRQRGEE